MTPVFHLVNMRTILIFQYKVLEQEGVHFLFLLCDFGKAGISAGKRSRLRRKEEHEDRSQIDRL